MFLSWALLLPHLIDSPSLDTETICDLARSVHEHCEVLAVYPLKIRPLANHNHVTIENLGLFTASAMYPELKKAAEWKAHAVAVLERCAAVQMTEDGGHLEGCPHYHVICMEYFIDALRLAQRYGAEFSPAYIEAFRKGVDYTVHSVRPSGGIVMWGDSEEDYAFAIQNALDGYALFQNEDALRIITALCGKETVRNVCARRLWYDAKAGEVLTAIDRAAQSGDAAGVKTPLLNWQRHLKQVMFRSGWDRNALSVFFACHTPIQNGHIHLDPCSFDFTAYGRPMIIDPGIFTYANTPERYEFKSTAYHSTLRLNERDAWQYVDTWTNGPQKPGKIVDAWSKPGVKAALARHESYEPVIHWRAVALMDDAVLLVIDFLENATAEDRAEIFYHIDSTKVNITGPQRIETVDAGQPNLLILPNAGMKAELLPGRVSPRCTIARPSTRLLLQPDKADKPPVAFATLLVPYAANAKPPEVGAPEIEYANDTLTCKYRWNGSERTFEVPLERFR